jgi:hypothetical protein
MQKRNRARFAPVTPERELIEWIASEFVCTASDLGFSDAGPSDAPAVAPVLFDRLAGCGYESISREAFELAFAMPEADRIDFVRRHVL